MCLKFIKPFESDASSVSLETKFKPGSYFSDKILNN